MTRFHSHRLRTGRYSADNQIYLLTTVTHNSKPIFNDVTTGRIVVKTLKNIHDLQRVSSLAFVIMPDHIHWLLQLHTEKLDSIMQAFKGVSANKINHHLGLNGKCWQPGYHDRAIRKEEDLTVVARYIVANPLRAGLVTTIRNYPLWDAVWL
ncbi:MAG: transposase [Methylophaga sp.]|nr:MAG: transposase [Methylophaga sp.]